jgi:ribonuclease P protein component
LNVYLCSMSEGFSKAYRLSSKKAIEALFQSKEKILVFPFLLRSNIVLDASPGFSILISVPKKKIKKAVARNHIKRMIREYVRKNKSIILSKAMDRNGFYHLSITYLWEEEPTTTLLEEKLNAIFQKL